MEFYTKKGPFRGQSPLAYNRPNESKELQGFLRDFNKAQKARGLKNYRSFLSKVVEVPCFQQFNPIYHMINRGEYAGAVSEARQLLSQTYDSPAEHRRVTQFAALIKKYPFPGAEETRKANAMRKFLRGERRNRHMNALLRARRTQADEFTGSDPCNRLNGLDPNPMVAIMRGFIARTIGHEPIWKDIMGECRWGPGSVVGVNGQFTHFARKLLSEEWTVTPSALPYAITAAKRFPMFWEVLGLTREYHVVKCEGPPERGDVIAVTCVDPELFEARFIARCVLVQENKVAFVPKDADCDRTIASEPLMNQFVQLALDQFMKKSLLKWKIDLEDQGPNQLMAYQGSVTGWLNPYVTADLKNASGSIYIELVRELFPAGWFTALNSLRSPSWTTGEEQARYHGFASMGNGFCFPVETLIFASICYAAHRYCGTRIDFRVYGDDIIVRQNESGVVQEYLRYFGFELNPEKSFFFGPFRESCGADWYDGEPVRPVYLDDELCSLEALIRSHNALIRNSEVPVAQCIVPLFPRWITALTRPYASETDEAVDNSAGTIANPIAMRCITWQSDAWYGLSFSAPADREICEHPMYNIAYRYGALKGASSDEPFTKRRETHASVARFSHAGGRAVKLPSESGHTTMVIPNGPPVSLGVTGFSLHI